MNPGLFIGRYQRGDTVFVAIVCRNPANDAPTVPDQAPSLDVYAAGHKVLTQPMIPIFQASATPPVVFASTVFLDNAFPEDSSMSFLASYAINGTPAWNDPITADLLPGGDQDGHVVGMYLLTKPEADIMIYQTERGRIRRGTNPR